MMFFMAGSRLIQVKCPSVLRDEAVSRFSYQTTVEGRVKAQVSPRQVMPRSWDVSASVVTPQDKAVLDELTSGLWGEQLQFIPADAPNVNVLTPAVSMLDTELFAVWSRGGPADLGADGFAADSIVMNDSSNIILSRPAETPVVPGHPVTGSAWVRGVSGFVMLQFLDHEFTLLNFYVSSDAAGSNDEFRRVSVSTVAPENARFARLTVRSALALTRPAVTWTDTVMPFGHGRAADQVTIHAMHHGLLHTHGARTLSDVSYTVQEVG